MDIFFASQRCFSPLLSHPKRQVCLNRSLIAETCPARMTKPVSLCPAWLFSPFLSLLPLPTAPKRPPCQTLPPVPKTSTSLEIRHSLLPSHPFGSHTQPAVQRTHFVEANLKSPSSPSPFSPSLHFTPRLLPIASLFFFIYSKNRLHPSFSHSLHVDTDGEASPLASIRFFWLNYSQTMMIISRPHTS